MVDTGATTLDDLLRIGRETLARAGVEDPGLDSRLLVEHFTGTTRTDAISSPKRTVDAATAERVMAAFDRRCAGTPVHRIIGSRAFYGLDLAISPETLEPRPDTETLVDAMLPVVRETVRRRGACRVLDLGTGTGAIALALLAEVTEATATGVDISREALATAARNAEELGLGGRFSTLCSDWFEKVSGRWDAIVSNPPYIPTDDIAGLAREVRDHEPLAALDGGRDGLDAYRWIAAQASIFLELEGHIGVEIGFDQKQDVIAIFLARGFDLVGSAKDLGGNDRALVFAVGSSCEDGN